MKDTVIILGTASTLHITPWDSEDCDYWACAPVITHKVAQGHRIDAIFEMHQIDYWTTIVDRLNNYVKNNPDVVVYMQDKYSQINNSEKFPLEEVQSSLNHPRMRKYFTSTIAYMIALAITKGYKTIELYGVHMASDEEEYSLQRECCSALLALAWGRGIDFWLPEESDIMKSGYLYGYEQQNGVILKTIRFRDGVKKGEDELKKKLDDLNERYWMQRGGAVILDKFINELKKQGIN